MKSALLSVQYSVVNSRQDVIKQMARTYSSPITETLCSILHEVSSGSRTCAYDKRPEGGSRGPRFGKCGRFLRARSLEGERRVIPRPVFVFKFPFIIIIAGKRCVRSFREATRMQIISGKWKPSIVIKTSGKMRALAH